MARYRQLDGGTIAANTDSTADFSTLTLSSATTVTLDGALTIGNLVFGDVGNTYGWTLSTGSGDPLTLEVSRGLPTITVNNQTTAISLVLAGTQGQAKAGNGTLLLSGANTYTGGTAINAGTLRLTGAGTLGMTGTNVAVSTNALLDLNGTSQSIAFTAGTGVGTVANNSGSGTSTLTLTANPLANVIIKDFTTTSGGRVAVVVAATSQGLNVSNTYSGGTTVNAGTFLYLQAASPNAAGTGPINLPSFVGTGATSSGLIVDGVTYANDITGAGYIHINGAGAAKFTGNLTTSGPLIFRSGTTGSYEFAGNGTTSVLSGVIGSTTSMVNGAVATGSLIKSGTGLLTLTGTNVYTGTTTISGGTLSIGGAGRLGSGSYAATITKNTAFNYGSSAVQTFSGVISGTGTLTLSAVNT